MFWHARTISKFLLKRLELQRDTLENGLSHSKTISKNTAPGNNPWRRHFYAAILRKTALSIPSNKISMLSPGTFRH